MHKGYTENYFLFFVKLCALGGSVVKKYGFEVRCLKFDVLQRIKLSAVGCELNAAFSFLLPAP